VFKPGLAADGFCAEIPKDVVERRSKTTFEELARPAFWFDAAGGIL